MEVNVLNIEVETLPPVSLDTGRPFWELLHGSWSLAPVPKWKPTLSWELCVRRRLDWYPLGVLRLPDGATYLPSLFAVFLGLQVGVPLVYHLIRIPKGQSIAASSSQVVGTALLFSYVL